MAQVGFTEWTRDGRLRHPRFLGLRDDKAAAEVVRRVTDVVSSAGRKIPISHADRVIFPAAGLTKLDLARYYASVGAVMVPHVRGRPLALHTFPHGLDGDGFFVKDTPRPLPRLDRHSRGAEARGRHHPPGTCNNTATLVYLAGQNMLTPHIWTSRADRLERPDRLIFDLDPSTQRFADVRAAARTLGEILRDLGLAPYAMTTGSRGLHVVTPLRRTAGYDEVHDFARAVAAVLVARDPDALTTEFRRDRRGDRIFVDVGRNAYGQHAVAPYGVRALPKAPVATPLRWPELDDARLDPQGWTVMTLADRLAEMGDPWHDIGRHARALGPARRALPD